MILGRSTALYLGLVAAVLNAAVVVLNVQLDTTQLAALNALAAAIVAIVANVSATGTAFSRATVGFHRNR